MVEEYRGEAERKASRLCSGNRFHINEVDSGPWHLIPGTPRYPGGHSPTCGSRLRGFHFGKSTTAPSTLGLHLRLMAVPDKIVFDTKETAVSRLSGAEPTSRFREYFVFAPYGWYSGRLAGSFPKRSAVLPSA